MISSTAIFACSNIEATLSFYKEVLGFESSWTWGDPPVFGSASMGGVTITFSLQPELAKHVRGHRALDFGCVWVNCHIPLVAEMPHGGFKHSGYGKDLSVYGLEDYTRIKHVMHNIGS